MQSLHPRPTKDITHNPSQRRCVGHLEARASFRDAIRSSRLPSIDSNVPVAAPFLDRAVGAGLLSRFAASFL